MRQARAALVAKHAQVDDLQKPREVVMHVRGLASAIGELLVHVVVVVVALEEDIDQLARSRLVLLGPRSPHRDEPLRNNLVHAGDQAFHVFVDPDESSAAMKGCSNRCEAFDP